MRIGLVGINEANRLIDNPLGLKNTTFERGETSDIIKEILAVAAKSSGQTRNLAPLLRGQTVIGTARNIWQFLRQNIRYKLDKSGYQFIKTPSVTIRDRYSDCKGYAILTHSILKNLGIRHYIRFANYRDTSDEVTHVYVVAFDENNTPVVIDACIPRFNSEKPFVSKIDYDMTKIIRVAGIGSTLSATKYELDPLQDAGMTSLLIARERLELERQINERDNISGIGEAANESYLYNLALLNEAIKNYNPANVQNLAASVSGVGSIGKTKVGKFLSKVADTAKKAAKTAAKVVTLPMRLAAKGILELTLPQAAMGFLYLFISDADAAKMPAKVQDKRRRQQKKANFVINAIGMKEEHFLGILRNGIMKQTGKTPEQLIAALQKKVSGIGEVVLGTIVVGLVTKLIQAIVKAFGKKDDTGDPQEMVPDQSDFVQALQQNASSILQSVAPRNVSVNPVRIQPVNAQGLNTAKLVDTPTETITFSTSSDSEGGEGSTVAPQSTTVTRGDTTNPNGKTFGVDNKVLLIGAAVLGGILILRK